MNATAAFEADNKLVSLDRKDCTVGVDKLPVTCTKVHSCLSYTGINLPSTIDIEVSWLLDSKKAKSPRIFFLNEEGKNIKNASLRLYRGRTECRTEAVYIAEGIRDKLTPIEVEMKYSIRQATTTYTTSTLSRRRRAPLEPVLNENQGTVQRDSINIMKNCGKDNVCIPDLKLDVVAKEKYLLGANESLTLDVKISNLGEDAFEASFFLNIPPGVDYKSTKRIGESRDVSYICTAPSAATNNTLKCDIGNPLPAGKSVHFNVFMEPSRRGKFSIAPIYEFYMEANSTNEEAEGGRYDNVKVTNISIFVESDLSISGSSSPSEFHYNATQYKSFDNATHEGDIGPQVVHIYDIRNNGTSTIEEIEIFIHWPAETLEEEPLMYLLNQPETLGPVSCEQSQFVNLKYSRDEFLIRDKILERKSYLDKNRSPIRQGDLGYSTTRYEFQGGSNQDEDSQEAIGDASLLNRNRGKSDSSHSSQSWKTSSGGGHSSSSSDHSSSRGGTRIQGTRNQGSRVQGQGFGWNIADEGGNSGASGTGRIHHEESSGSTHDSRGSQGFGWGISDKSGSSSETGRHDASSNDGKSALGGFVNTILDGFKSGANQGGAGDAKVHQFEYNEHWNSSSVNGGPAVVHHSSHNKSSIQGQDGRVAVSEVSTERVYTGRIGVGWDDRNAGHSSQHYEDSSSQSQSEYERKQHEYYETQRRIQEEQKRRLMEDRARRQQEQRIAEEERFRLEEETRRREDERRRIQLESSSRTTQTSSQGQGGYSSFSRGSETSGGSRSSFNKESNSASR